MANVAGAFGFIHWGTASGPPNFAQSENPPYRIAAGYSTAIFFGDAVRMNVSGTPTGFIEQWANGDGSATKMVVGIFTGCRYFSTSQKKTVWNNYWPGSDATGDVVAFVVDDPNSFWKVQATTGPITQAMLGFGADITASEVQPPQPPHPVPERKAAAVMRGDDGNQAQQIQWFNETWEIQPPQPPHPIPERKAAGVMRGDDGNEAPPIQWFNMGWEVQPPQPPHPRPERGGAFLFGHAGIEAKYVFVPPPPSTGIHRTRFIKNVQTLINRGGL